MTNRFATALLLAGAVSLAACQKKAPEELPPPPVDETTGVDTGNQVTGPTVGTQEHFLQAVGAENTVIYFNTDEFNVDSEDASLEPLRKLSNQLLGVLDVAGIGQKRV